MNLAMKVRIALLLCAAALAAMTSCSRPAQRLVIVHVNDTHSHLDPLRDGRCGVIERAAVIDSIRSSEGEGHVLLLHAGDFDQGTSYYNVLGGSLEVDIINAMRYDCVTLGNHEFDNGIEDLMSRLGRIKCPVVCANYDFSPFEGGDKVKPCAVIDRGGYKVGIIGMLCDLSSMVSRTISDRIPRVGDDTQVANGWAARLRDKEGCDIVIVLSHMGFEADCAYAARSCGVDCIIGGHSHTFMDEPALINDKDGKAVPVVQDGCWGYEIGALTVSGKSASDLE